MTGVSTSLIRCPLSQLFRAGVTALFLYIVPTASAGAPRRVVSLLPSHTDILVTLGALEQVVAVADAEDARLYPALPRVGGMEMSWEALVRLRPDLILADTSHRRHDPQFQRLHLPVVYLPSTQAATVEDVLALVAEIGRQVGRQERASRWVAEAQKRVHALEARRGPGPGPRVYFEIWPQPLQACGPRSLAGSLIARSGARNVVVDPAQVVPLMSAEAVVQADPQVILHTGLESNAEIAARPGWGGVAAVKAGRVMAVNADDFSRAGPRILDAWETLLNLLARVTP